MNALTRRSTVRGVLAVAAFLLGASAEAGITSISAHDDTFSPGATVPVFVDSGAKSSIMVKGPAMDLCTGVESNDHSFTVSIGRRILGGNSAVEILVGAGSAPDGDGATISIKFAVGQETFKVKAFKSKVTGYAFLGKPALTCEVGESVTLEVKGDVASLDKGVAGAMLDVADNRYELGSRMPSSTSTSARFPLKCTATGSFQVKPQWFKDGRVGNPAGDRMVRGTETASVTVTPKR